MGSEKRMGSGSAAGSAGGPYRAWLCWGCVDCVVVPRASAKTGKPCKINGVYAPARCVWCISALRAQGGEFLQQLSAQGGGRQALSPTNLSGGTSVRHVQDRSGTKVGQRAWVSIQGEMARNAKESRVGQRWDRGGTDVGQPCVCPEYAASTRRVRREHAAGTSRVHPGSDASTPGVRVGGEGTARGRKGDKSVARDLGRGQKGDIQGTIGGRRGDIAGARMSVQAQGAAVAGLLPLTASASLLGGASSLKPRDHVGFQPGDPTGRDLNRARRGAGLDHAPPRGA